MSEQALQNHRRKTCNHASPNSGELNLTTLGVENIGWPRIPTGEALITKLESLFSPTLRDTGDLQRLYSNDDLLVAADHRRWYVGFQYDPEFLKQYFVVSYPRDRADREQLKEAAKDLKRLGPSDDFSGSVGCLRAGTVGVDGTEFVDIEMIQSCLSFSIQKGNVGKKLSALLKKHIGWRENNFELLLDLARSNASPVAVTLDRRYQENLARQLMNTTSDAYEPFGARMIDRAVENSYVSVRYGLSDLIFYPRFAGVETPSIQDSGMREDNFARHRDPFRRGHLSLATDLESPLSELHAVVG